MITLNVEKTFGFISKENVNAYEKKVQEALDRVMEHRTSVVVAHRLTTVRNAKITYVFDAGEIKEQGTHDELLARKGYYYELVRRQLTQEDLDLLKYKINQAYKIASQSADDYVLKTVTLLVENGADVNAKDSDGKPVIFSALVGTRPVDLEILKFLISKGADVNIRDAQGNTPLFYAFGNQEAVDILLAAGADKSLYNYSGMRYDEYTKRTKSSYVDADGSVKSEYIE